MLNALMKETKRKYLKPSATEVCAMQMNLLQLLNNIKVMKMSNP